MSVSVIIFAWRKPNTSPADFREHYENGHVPLLKSMTGPLFPLSHTRHYILRHPKEGASASDTTNAAFPPVVVVGEPADFDYDSYAELVFADAGALQKFQEVVTQPENAAKLQADEEKFLDRAKLRIAMLGETTVTTVG